MLLPKKIFFTRGIGRGETQLQSFENALRDADIAAYNLVSVSSILPPYAEIVDKSEGIKLLSYGQILFTVLARNSSNELNRMISSAIGVAVPSDRSKWGYLSEHHTFGQTENDSGHFAEKLAAEMLASTMGLDDHLKWEDKKNEYVLDDKILTTKNIAATTVVLKPDEWATVIAAAVLVV
ncbi:MULTISPECIES: pyruvoyl-dependent arginine decarboxylase [Ferroplasma]|jgi:arginine decarboxylase|uniref:Pyruvoyl-dependent arginine decarboxylase n=2 Tax=Ferroplasma TaxID=74968 RepID=S0APU9_FERAC|nr:MULTISPECIES: arginine decarboxylase, pyruvoyl-dependent [Ferroplasma]MCL4349350.1 arginine decarboxylase, pyruvoyl-dependent [Candidatus Thermoplasmatota archaeon]AGO61278.1 pyruvoyl-dependent arginine decarboxylase [Ferroplasma acidarmanus Fer1]ARD84232.1 pyruvoyl-dependent arginine decarboxylase [Ferroplasma acidiphilum]NOL60113.1 arginine decarboxylase, pyruvoyl-dependent [Ferroplasma acidiphilum]WMT53139.1 MAG: arginine decarboxylase, pyruvoyl-dependent [Ferroplasma acidiphilum]